MSFLMLGIIGGLITGLSTIVGGALILIKNEKIENILKKMNADFIIGVMIVAAAFSLIIPAYKDFNTPAIYLVSSIGLGVIFIAIIQLILSKINDNKKSNNKLLFIIGILAHNFPEGLASGSSMNLNDYSVLSAISIQNIPEGLITTLSFIALGFSPIIAFLANFATGITEIIGGVLGGYYGGIMNDILPLIMGFAGGSMMYVSLKELYDSINQKSIKILVSPSFLIGGLTMFLLTI